MAEAKRPGGLYKTASGDIVDANGKPLAPEASGEAPTLSGLKTAELEAVAKAEGVDLSGATTNDERRAAIEAARGASGENA